MFIDNESNKSQVYCVSIKVKLFIASCSILKLVAQFPVIVDRYIWSHLNFGGLLSIQGCLRLGKCLCLHQHYKLDED